MYQPYTNIVNAGSIAQFRVQSSASFSQIVVRVPYFSPFSLSDRALLLVIRKRVLEVSCLIWAKVSFSYEISVKQRQL